MAIGAGDIVTPSRVSADYTTGYQAQPLCIGVCDAVGGGDDRTILWEDGRLEANIDEDTLDALSGGVSQTLMIAKVVELAINPSLPLQPSPSYDGVVLAQFRRNPAGAGVLGPDRLQVKLLGSKAYYEVLARDANQLDDR